MPSLAGEKSEEGRETIVLACRREARELTPLPEGRGVGAALDPLVNVIGAWKMNAVR